MIEHHADTCVVITTAAGRCVYARLSAMSVPPVCGCVEPIETDTAVISLVATSRGTAYKPCKQQNNLDVNTPSSQADKPLLTSSNSTKTVFFSPLRT